jgi:ketosteroid isomerase-like protein
MIEVDIEAEKGSILRIYAQWLEMEERKDIEGPMRFIAEDAIFSPPNRPMVKGFEAIREHRKAFLSQPSVSVNVDTERVEVSSSGDLAYQLVIYRVVLEGGNVGEWNACLVWRKEDGEWRCVLLIYNSSKPTG